MNNATIRSQARPRHLSQVRRSGSNWSCFLYLPQHEQKRVSVSRSSGLTRFLTWRFLRLLLGFSTRALTDDCDARGARVASIPVPVPDSVSAPAPDPDLEAWALGVGDGTVCLGGSLASPAMAGCWARRAATLPAPEPAGKSVAS